MSDVFGLADSVQFVKSTKYPPLAGESSGRRGSTFQADTIIKLPCGVRRISVPRLHAGYRPINRTEIAYSIPWQTRHLRRLREALNRSPNFEAVKGMVSDIISQRHDSLAELNKMSFLWCLGWILGYRTSDCGLEGINEKLSRGEHAFRLRRVVLLSSVPTARLDGAETTSLRLVRACKAFGATEYVYGGTAAKAYMDHGAFDAAGIKLLEQRWECPPYRQQFERTGFAPNLSIVDLLANEDMTTTRRVLSSEQ